MTVPRGLVADRFLDAILEGVRFVFAASVLAACLAFAPKARAAHQNDASIELVREARAHEAAHEDDIAARRYTEAVQIDPGNGDAYLGLGQVRLRMGEPREAERVYTVALEHLPQLHRALEGRARARWALGRHDEAEQDLESYAVQESDPAGWRSLAAWYGEDGRAPAQLAAWRRLLALAGQMGDVALSREARLMVRTLQIVVGPADPASAPLDEDPTRRALARIARRGG
jgi:tetratricopeptide (TPR) repeat protein